MSPQPTWGPSAPNNSKAIAEGAPAAKIPARSALLPSLWISAPVASGLSDWHRREEIWSRFALGMVGDKLKPFVGMAKSSAQAPMQVQRAISAKYRPCLSLVTPSLSLSRSEKQFSIEKPGSRPHFAGATFIRNPENPV